MRLLWILLPVLAQGAAAQLFKKEPESTYVVRQGQAVTLECETQQPSTCAWKLGTPDLRATGFILSNIPANLDITARDPNSKTDCTVTLNNIDNRYDGFYTCSPFMSGGAQEDANRAEVIVARKPVQIQFTGEAAGSSELQASAEEASSISCEASGARPKAKLAWYLDNTQIYDGIEEVDVEEVDGQGQKTKLMTSRSTLNHQFSRGDNGARLRCLANHPAYDEQEASQEVALIIDVQYAPYRPEGNSIGKIYGFTAEQEGVITVNFTSNPAPVQMSWKVGEATAVSAGGQSLDGRFTASQLDTLDADMGRYALTLTINPVMVADQQKTFELRLQNAVGDSRLDFSIGTGPAPPPQAMGTGAIVGIVVALLVLLVIIALVAFGRSQGKWCFAEDADSRNNRLLKSDKAEGDVEMAQDKEEKRELTQPDGEVDGGAPPKKEGEVVYAELVLNSDGVKTEVRPSADRTEYAVIVPPTAQNGEQLPPPPTNNVDNREAE